MHAFKRKVELFDRVLKIPKFSINDAGPIEIILDILWGFAFFTLISPYYNKKFARGSPTAKIVYIFTT